MLAMPTQVEAITGFVKANSQHIVSNPTSKLLKFTKQIPARPKTITRNLTPDEMKDERSIARKGGEIVHGQAVFTYTVGTVAYEEPYSLDESLAIFINNEGPNTTDTFRIVFCFDDTNEFGDAVLPAREAMGGMGGMEVMRVER